MNKERAMNWESSRLIEWREASVIYRPVRLQVSVFLVVSRAAQILRFQELTLPRALASAYSDAE